MEKLLFKPYDKEHMRMAMLKHEATFKEQVYELHRLYQIQKILMKNASNQRAQTRKVDSDTEQQRETISAVNYGIMNKINIRDEADGGDGGDNGGASAEAKALEVIDESEIELTLGPTSYSRRGRRPRQAAAAEGPMNSDSGPSFSSSSTGSTSQMMMNRTAGRSNNNSYSRETTGRLPETASSGYQTTSKSNNSNNISGVVEEELRLKHPPWLFQVLSLNMT